MNIVIVESPAKCKTLTAYMGSGWLFTASVGHIRDLPNDSLGFDEATFDPSYIVTKPDVVASLKSKISNASMVWLATDPDREGEAISWHLLKTLGLKDHQYKRVVFNELTKSALQKAFQNPRKIDFSLVDAQQARRVLDRAIGWIVSPAISDKAMQNLSAGRVQSVALYIIISREREINAFTKTDHYGVRANFGAWFADWDSKEYTTEETPYFTNQSLVKYLLDVKDFEVQEHVKSERSRKPSPPFTTSTLQQIASTNLSFSTKKTMQLAQKLYESGYITYMRTDSQNLSVEAIATIRDFLSSEGMSSDVPENPNVWASKDNAQEAHEAIRPSVISRVSLDDLGKDENALYELIRNRAIASQMKSAVYNDVTVKLKSKIYKEDFPKGIFFNAKSSILKYPGWLKVFDGSCDVVEEPKDRDSNLIPDLAPGNTVTSFENTILKFTTKPPNRYTEASLVKKLEKEGIGRPSTYSSIIQNILDRGYVSIQKRLFFAQTTGELVIKALEGNFSFLDIEYTRSMELQLDSIAQGLSSYKDLVKDCYKTVEKEVAAMTFAGQTYKCPSCERPLKRIGTANPFWGCTGYSDGTCKETYPDDNGVPYFHPATALYKCTVCCASPLKRIKRKNGKWAWIGVDPKCRSFYDEKNGKPAASETHNCPACCEQQLIRRKGSNGYFWGCSGYKTNNCSYTAKDINGRPEKKLPCSHCDGGFLRRVDNQYGDKQLKKIWICSNFKQGCKIKYPDKGNKPLISEPIT